MMVRRRFQNRYDASAMSAYARRCHDAEPAERLPARVRHAMSCATMRLRALMPMRKDAS